MFERVNELAAHHIQSHVPASCTALLPVSDGAFHVRAHLVIFRSGAKAGTKHSAIRVAGLSQLGMRLLQ
jgi:hypothetical protein